MVPDECHLTGPEEDFDALLDRFEVGLVGGPPMECEVVNRFTPGLYIRECRMAAGTTGTSMIHKFEHVFILAEGVITVRDQDGIQHLAAPHVGITKPGTRRALLAHTKVVWITVHPNPDECRDIETIVARLTEPHENPAVPPEQANQWRFNQTLAIES